jgi:hypothetical protein
MSVRMPPARRPLAAHLSPWLFALRSLRQHGANSFLQLFALCANSCRINKEGTTLPKANEKPALLDNTNNTAGVTQ